MLPVVARRRKRSPSGGPRHGERVCHMPARKKRPFREGIRNSPAPLRRPLGRAVGRGGAGRAGREDRRRPVPGFGMVVRRGLAPSGSGAATATEVRTPGSPGWRAPRRRAWLRCGGGSRIRPPNPWGTNRRFGGGGARGFRREQSGEGGRAARSRGSPAPGAGFGRSSSRVPTARGVGRGWPGGRSRPPPAPGAGSGGRPAGRRRAAPGRRPPPGR